MKKYWIPAVLAAVVVLAASCGGPRRNPGRAYMPDMAYSRAYETYASTEKLKEKYPGITYSAMPVPGTIARGDMLSIYPYANDSAGYVSSASVKNPLNADSIDMKEAERKYLIFCGVCHGAKLDGNGPLWKDGKGPFPAAPKNFMAEDMKKMAEGTMFHSVTYGKGTMGSYASQLDVHDRWAVIAYIKNKQGGGADTAKAAMTTAAITAPADTAKKGK
ncbi:MAG: cytochrome c [Chitinophagaceae bacterium]|nr:cytochrome c [Chitinophagaceae bacterium]